MCSLFFERFVLFFCLKIERFVPDSAEIWICGLYINAKDKWGNTLLHYIAGSSQRGAKEAVDLVMDFGKPDVNAVNNEGKTALDIATEKNDESLVKFLLKYD